MRRIYYISFLWPILVVVGVMLSSPLFIGLHFSRRWFLAEVFLLCLIGVFALLCWSVQILTIRGDRIIRRTFFIKTATHAIRDVISVKKGDESDIYGTLHFTTITFRNGDRWNLVGIRRKDLGDLISRNRAFSPNFLC